ncbi:helix-turn-helix domain-containing protein [Sulfobacillus harzensis]|uniref:Helix-turn-helix domain-containing protein n=1 Tax=Sulfobacillus harzensis TaxID=2729629 RepID=A0A7Y0L6V7_9FIRM|nr:helix-turn-helix domain-containing protein [Sulfobacillus harzensis]NMP24037.1 helix-turn-helix domain-containing protein [Sulfobacillus harzensis]
MRRRWTTHEIDRALALYRAGLPVTVIGRVVGHPASSVHGLMRRRGLRRRRRWEPQDDAQLVAWKSLTQIARELERSPEAVRKRRQRLQQMEGARHGTD